MSVPFYPLLLQPLLKERIWGGETLTGLHGLDESDTGSGATPIGESWLLSDDNVIRNGEFAGERVVDVIAQWGGDLLGRANVDTYGTKLALMAKFLDAADDLSIQVHPDDAYALEHEAHTGHLGKSEAWYVMAAEPGASVVWGFNRTVSAAEVRHAVASGTLEALLNRVPVQAGDVVVNPAGTVHAVGAGLLLFEIQQSSDLTYRLYDYDRRDAAGEPRELLVDKALAVADLHGTDPAEAVARTPRARQADDAHTASASAWRPLVATAQFTLHGATISDAGCDCATTPDSFDLLVVTTGSVSVEAHAAVGEEGFATLTLRRGDTALLPAALGAYRLTGRGDVLRSRVAGG